GADHLDRRMKGLGSDNRVHLVVDQVHDFHPRREFRHELVYRPDLEIGLSTLDRSINKHLPAAIQRGPIVIRRIVEKWRQGSPLAPSRSDSFHAFGSFKGLLVVGCNTGEHLEKAIKEGLGFLETELEIQL